MNTGNVTIDGMTYYVYDLSFLKIHLWFLSWAKISTKNMAKIESESLKLFSIYTMTGQRLKCVFFLSISFDRVFYVCVCVFAHSPVRIKCMRAFTLLHGSERINSHERFTWKKSHINTSYLMRTHLNKRIKIRRKKTMQYFVKLRSHSTFI